MNILIIGQCTLHWGRMEFGNIGNYYIIEPLVRELHQAFPGSRVRTTMQMSQRFCKDENVEVLPMDLYYGWRDDDLDVALNELAIASLFSKTGYLAKTTKYIDEVLDSDLVLDFSGDIWGDNANFLGPNRFLIGLIKDRVAQLLGKKTAMIAGSPGPFDEQSTIAFAKEVYENFNLVTNRESISIDLLKSADFNISNTVSLACPAFLFEPKPIDSMADVFQNLHLDSKSKLKVGFIICGWNFIDGPFDKWPRDNSDYEIFAKAVEYLELKYDALVYLMSHSNGFQIPPNPFVLQHGRDYAVTKQLESVLKLRGIAKNFTVIEQVLDAWDTKAVIGQFDLLVSGRIHGAVAGLSQLVPTVIIDYGHEPKAHKLRGFAIEAGAEEYLADPFIKGDIERIIDSALNHIEDYRDNLHISIPLAKLKARQNFSKLRSIFE